MDDLDDLLRTIRRLSERPKWRWPKEDRDDLRGEHALPLLCLIGPADATEVVAEVLVSRLRPDPAKVRRTPRRLVPSAAVRADDGIVDAAEGRPLLPLLNLLVTQLGTDRYGAGREIPFHTFRLLDWLTRHKASTLDRDQQMPLRGKLLEWYSPPVNEGEDVIGPALAAVTTDKALALSRVVPRMARVLGRWLWVHGLRGGEPRWLMRQPYMVPAHSAGFLRFARRLTVDNREHENLRQMKLLLVHAFLRDLRLFYGTRTWRLRRWRRTGYVTVVLRGITELNGGWELLRLINDVRNQTGAHDPLLVVATATGIPEELNLTAEPVSKIEKTVATWKQWLPWKRQQFEPTARFIAVRLDRPPAVPGEVGECWEPRRMPWFARKWVSVAAVLALLIGSAAAAAPAWLREDPCGGAELPSAATAWMPETNECIGFSAAGFVFGSTDKLRRAQEAVFEQNAVADRLHGENPGRPVLTLVYIAELTHPTTREGTDDAEAEELTGLLIQQAEANTIGNSTDDALNPLLRIVIANGGYQMKHARRTVDQFVVPLAQRDDTVMGVVGGGRTVAETESAIGVLGAHGIPLLATTLTGESLHTLSSLYFQLSAGNGPQARLIAEYAASAGKSVTVFHPDLALEPDEYLKSLHDQFAALQSGPAPIRFSQWRTPSTADVRCGTGDIVFYAGRETGFTDFLSKVLETCPLSTRPTVIGDDAITRFIAQGESRRSTKFAGASLGYVSLANRVVLAGNSCVATGDPDPATRQDYERPMMTFCKGLHRLYSPSGDKPPAWRAFGEELAKHDGNRRWTGERVGTAYDAAGLYVYAAVRTKSRVLYDPDKRNPHRATVAQEFREFDCAAQASTNCFKGVSGWVDFRNGRDGRNRPLAILTINDLNATEVNPVCTFRFQDSAPCP
ncbi:ABC transporter substrate-binding protein [Lentzea nigeriaca]|uniref:ABC transporter substrate-binding protein n=1 Tax=Lentzea nigeriaca TaxID=1128665 RepID=UPI0019570CB5|nr:hypothetical protein [Lentzea nigeriaca]MBM7863038.1 hypothetical protein [Lentzea nigeriaca]